MIPIQNLTALRHKNYLQSPMRKHWGLNKYLLIAKHTWDETLTYRFNFVMWRFRVVLAILTMYFLWSSILPQNQTIAGYDKTLMLTYILGTSLISSIVLASRSYEVGDEINQGNLSNFLLRPINYFKFWFFRDLGDKAMNLVFSIFELSILFIILHPPFFFQKDPFFLLLALASAIIAMIMHFFVVFLLGLTAFWNAETWAPRFIFVIVLNFASGGLFPLDILPKNIFNLLQYFPFTYLLYFPIKIYLGQLNLAQITSGLLISTIWTVLFYQFVKFVWARGLRVYTAYGR